MALSGRVKKWDDERGFGFIGPDQGSEDLFVHRTGLPSVNHSLAVGSAVMFDTEVRDNKPRCINVSGEGVVDRIGGAWGGKGGGWSAPAAPSSQPTTCPPGKQQGIVRKWMDERGFGFIGPDGGGDDIFVLRSSFGNQGGLVEGGVVFFVTQDNPKNPGKLQAAEVEGPAITDMRGKDGWGKGGKDGWGKGGWGGWDSGWGKGSYGAPWGGGSWGGAGGGAWGGPPQSAGGAWGGGAAAPSPAVPASAPPPATADTWKTAKDPEGKTYYYNTRTNETSWDPPAGYHA
eukprot:TRINITY_DN1071_c0_g1_i1.p1 TRINITY_DN1071_c0_g1~~TRINITY_DN1071_c0_g1_i1.p1  ORF type:complete len:315 (+),score=88.22 TRINITY_DN1071_c0_g1_i1:85-945(+)